MHPTRLLPSPLDALAEPVDLLRSPAGFLESPIALLRMPVVFQVSPGGLLAPPPSSVRSLLRAPLHPELLHPPRERVLAGQPEIVRCPLPIPTCFGRLELAAGAAESASGVRSFPPVPGVDSPPTAAVLRE